MLMKKDLKKFEQFIRKISKEPGVDFTNKLMDKLREEHPCFKKNSNNNFSWQIINLININNMKKSTISFAIFAIVFVAAGIFLHFNSETRLADAFLEKAYARYEKIIQNNFAHKIELMSGDNFEDYLAIFDSEDNIDLGVQLREYGRISYVFNMISSPAVDLYYEKDQPILKINNNNKTRYFKYSLEKGINPETNPWEEIFPQENYTHADQILTLINTLKMDPKTTIIENNDKEIVFSHPTDIKLGTGDIISEEYHFNKKTKELIKKDETTLRDGKKYTLRTETITRSETDDKTLSFAENDRLISLSAEQYYYGGGANGYQYVATFNYDKQNEKIITIGDIFKDYEKGLKKLSDYSREKLPDLVKEYFVEDFVNDGTKPIAKNFSQFNFTQDENEAITGINLHFAEYQVAPGCVGAVDLFIPIDEINDLLK